MIKLIKFIIISSSLSILNYSALASEDSTFSSNLYDGIFPDKYRIENDSSYMEGNIKKSNLYKQWQQWCKSAADWGTNSTEDISWYCAKWFNEEIEIKNKSYGFAYVSSIYKKNRCLYEAKKISLQKSKFNFITDTMKHYNISRSTAEELFTNKKITQLARDKKINRSTAHKSCSDYILEALIPKQPSYINKRTFMVNGTAKESYRDLINNDNHWIEEIKETNIFLKKKGWEERSIDNKEIERSKKNQCKDLEENNIPTLKENIVYCWENHGRELLIAEDSLLECEDLENRMRYSPVSIDKSKNCLKKYGIPLYDEGDKVNPNYWTYDSHKISCYFDKGYINKQQEKESIISSLSKKNKITEDEAISIYNSGKHNLAVERLKQSYKCAWVISKDKESKRFEYTVNLLLGSNKEEKGTSKEAKPTKEECKAYDKKKSYDQIVSQFIAFECANMYTYPYFKVGKKLTSLYFIPGQIWQNQCLVEAKLINKSQAKEDFLKKNFNVDREAGLEFYENDSLKLLVERKNKSYVYSGGCETYLSYLKLSLSEAKGWPRYILKKRGYEYPRINQILNDGTFKEYLD